MDIRKTRPNRSPVGRAALLALVLAATLAGKVDHPLFAAEIIEADIVVFGGTSGGVVAAVQAARMGKTVAIAEPSKHLGGMSASGLSWTDFGRKEAVGGLAREFYRRVGAHYGKPEEYALEPHVAEQVFKDWAAEAKAVVRFDQRLASVRKQGRRIREIAMEDGTIFRGKMFIDATYEGDLMARAGVACTVGREANAQYDETLNGIQLREIPRVEWGAVKPNGRRKDNRGLWDRAIPLDPFVIAGDATSGLLPLVQSGELGRIGDADPGVQSYCYRLCLTTKPSNRLPIDPPEGYSESRYELVARYIETCRSAGDVIDLRWFTKHDPLPNEKFDMNTAYFGLNYSGESSEYPEAGYERRVVICDEHERYARGLLHFLATSSRVPENVRRDISRYGLCKDEFVDNGGWPHQLYVREARRMVSDLVMTEHHCLGKQVAPDPVALAAYGIDIHEVRRIVHDGILVREGKLFNHPGVPRPYPIGYQAIVPRPQECENLFVTFALSASHVAFGSIRMEPVLMALSQSAATAASMAIETDIGVQAVDQARLRARLMQDGQVLEAPGRK